MKTKHLLAVFAVALAALAAPGVMRTPQLQWTLPAGAGSNTVTILYWRTTLPSGSDTNWTLLVTKGPGLTNHVLTNFPPQRAFFVATSSNVWGESPFSNMAEAPEPPVSTGHNLQLQ
jgi:hypothetical protein